MCSNCMLSTDGTDEKNGYLNKAILMHDDIIQTQVAKLFAYISATSTLNKLNV